MFVAVSGSDATGDGTKAKPFATIKKAQGAIKGARAATATTNTAAHGTHIIWLRGGTYYEAVQFDPTDSGSSASSPLVLASWPGENATLSAGTALRGLAWSKVPGTNPSQYKAALGASPTGGAVSFSGLFSNGKRLTRARFPNCDDITGTLCYTLNVRPLGVAVPVGPACPVAGMVRTNKDPHATYDCSARVGGLQASGPVEGGSPTAPTHDLQARLSNGLALHCLVATLHLTVHYTA